MSTKQDHQAIFTSIVPRFAVGKLEQALPFYGQLGFALTYQDEGFAIIERDEIALPFTVSEGHSVCWIRVTNIEALYQEYLLAGAVQSSPQAQPWA